MDYYTLAYLRNRVISDKLDDPEYDPGTVDRFINDAQKDVANTFELPFSEKNFSGLLTAGERVFEYPFDLQLLQSAKITGPNGQRDITDDYMKFREFNKAFPTPANNTPSPISRWTLFGGKMYVSAPLDGSYQMEIFYIKTPARLQNDTDVPEVPYSFEEVLVLGAYIRCLKRNEDNDIAAATQIEYNNQLDRLSARYSKRHAAGPHVMGQPTRRA